MITDAIERSMTPAAAHITNATPDLTPADSEAEGNTGSHNAAIEVADHAARHPAAIAAAAALRRGRAKAARTPTRPTAVEATASASAAGTSRTSAGVPLISTTDTPPATRPANEAVAAGIHIRRGVQNASGRRAMSPAMRAGAGLREGIHTSSPLTVTGTPSTTAGTCQGNTTSLVDPSTEGGRSSLIQCVR